MAMLVAMPSEQIGGLRRLHDGHPANVPRLGVGWLVGIALHDTLSLPGRGLRVSGSLRAMPFVAGIDNYLPAAFGRIHPKWNTPYVAVFFYGVAGMLFAFPWPGRDHGQRRVRRAGEHERHHLLHSLFVSVCRHDPPCSAEPAGPDVIRVPGGRRVAILLAVLGLITTSITICLSVLPSDDEPNKPLAVIKVVGMTFVLLAAGIVIYSLGKRRQARSLAARAAIAIPASLVQNGSD
jgi:hypothetical protein